MRYQALILDVDGTLIGYDRAVSPRVLKSIEGIKNKVIVSLSSGRVYESIRKYVDELGLTTLQMCDGGGAIFDPVKNAAVYQKIIPPDVAQKIILELKKNKLDFLVSYNSRYYLDKKYLDPKALEKYQFFVPGLPDINAVKNPALTKITIMGVNPKNTKQIEKILRKYSDSIHYIIAAYALSKTIGVHALDITEKSATKLTSLEEYAKLTGIDLKQTIVVGDGYNDFPMLMAGGLKVAMGNAVEDLKKIADYVAPSVSEDGVADVIEKFIL